MSKNANEISFEIREHIGVIASYDSGWNKELNIVAWNGATPKYDIREWDPDHERMSKGVTLLDREMRAVVDLFLARNSRNAVNQSKEEKQARESRKSSISRPSYKSEADKMSMEQLEPLEDDEPESSVQEDLDSDSLAS